MKYFKLFVSVNSYVCMKVGGSVLMWELGCAQVHPQIKNIEDVAHLISHSNELTKDQFDKEMGEIVAAGYLIDASHNAGNIAYKLLGITMCTNSAHNSMQAHPAFKSFFEQVKLDNTPISHMSQKIPQENK